MSGRAWRTSDARLGPVSGRALPRRLLTFLRERFPPASVVPLVGLLVAAGFVPGTILAGGSIDPLRFVLTALAVAAALLHMRMVDEVKDAPVDLAGRPDRPLPRGLVSVRELLTGAVLLLALIVVLGALLGPVALAGALLIGAWLFLADLDFGAPRAVHADLLVYALLHSPVVPLLLLFAWTASGAPLEPLGPLVLLMWLAWSGGLGLEMGRKIRAPDEERPWVETYSAALGVRRATLLAGGALVMGCLAAAAFGRAVGAPDWVVTAPIAFGAALVCGSLLLAGRLRSRAVASISSVAAAALLAWPVLVSSAGAPW